MGQYFKAVILDPTTDKTTISAAVQAWDYNCGAKLPEHAWSKNPFVLALESLLSPGGRFYKHRLSWAGNYADDEPGSGETLYRMAKPHHIKPRSRNAPNRYRYVLNHSKGLYIDKKEIPVYDGWRVHPLPYLTFDGDLDSVGIYREAATLAPYIGAWARDIISVEETPPKEYRNLLERH